MIPRRAKGSGRTRHRKPATRQYCRFSFARQRSYGIADRAAKRDHPTCRRRFLFLRRFAQLLLLNDMVEEFDGIGELTFRAPWHLMLRQELKQLLFGFGPIRTWCDAANEENLGPVHRLCTNCGPSFEWNVVI